MNQRASRDNSILKHLTFVASVQISDVEHPRLKLHCSGRSFNLSSWSFAEVVSQVLSSTVLSDILRFYFADDAENWSPAQANPRECLTLSEVVMAMSSDVSSAHLTAELETARIALPALCRRLSYGFTDNGEDGIVVTKESSGDDSDIEGVVEHINTVLEHEAHNPHTLVRRQAPVRPNPVAGGASVPLLVPQESTGHEMLSPAGHEVGQDAVDWCVSELEELALLTTLEERRRRVAEYGALEGFSNRGTRSVSLNLVAFGNGTNVVPYYIYVRNRLAHMKSMWPGLDEMVLAKLLCRKMAGLMGSQLHCRGGVAIRDSAIINHMAAMNSMARE